MVKYDKYSFTVKKNCPTYADYAYPTKEDYEIWLGHCIRLGCIVGPYFYEIDSEDRLHVHGDIDIPRSLHRRKLCINALHIKMEKLEDETDAQKWARYARKGFVNSYAQQQMIDCNYFRHHGPFFPKVPDDFIPPFS